MPSSGAQTGNVFLAYRNQASIDALIDKWMTTKNAVYDFTAEDGIQHTVWTGIVTGKQIGRAHV